MAVDPIVSYSHKYPPTSWSSIQDRLFGASGSDLWHEVTVNYHRMLVKAGDAYVQFLENDPVTTRTGEDFRIDPTGFGRSLVDAHYDKKNLVMDNALEIIEEEDEIPEEWSEISTIASTISSTISTTSGETSLTIATLGDAAPPEPDIERAEITALPSLAFTDPPKEADRTARSPSPSANADPQDTGADRTALSLPSPRHSRRAKIQNRIKRIFKALSCFV